MKKDILAKLQNILFLFILFLLLLFFSPLSNDPFWVAERFFFEFCIALLIIIILLRVLLKSSFVYYNTPYNFLFAGFLILNIIGVFKVYNYFLWLDALFLNICYFVFFFVSFDYCRQDKNNYKKIIILILFSNFIASLYGIIQSSGFDLLKWQTDFSKRAASTLGNPNFLAGQLIIAIPIAFSLFFSNKISKPISVFLIFVLASGLVLSQTRGAYIAFFISLIIFLVLIFKYENETFNKYKNAIIMILFSILMISIIYIIINPQIRTRIKDALILKDSSASIRIALWKNTMHLIKENPLLGSGPGNFEIKYAYYQYKSLKYKDYFETDFYKSGHAHNDLLQIMGEYGLPASGFIIMIFYVFFLNSIKVLKEKNDLKFFIIAVLSAIAGILVHGCFNFPLIIIPTAATVYVLLGTSAAQEDKYNFKNINLNLISKIIILLLILILVVISSLVMRSFISNCYLRKSGEATHFKMNRVAIEHSSAAVDYAPWEYENYYVNASDHLQAGEIEKAYKIYEKVFKLNPGHWETNIFLFDFYASNNMREEALKIAENMYELSPYSLKALTSYGYALYINGKFDKAILIYEKAFYNLPEKYDILYHLSAAYGATGDTQKAIYFAQRAINASSNNEGAYYNLAVAYIKSGESEKAKETLKEMLKKYPDNKNAKELLKVLKDANKK